MKKTVLFAILCILMNGCRCPDAQLDTVSERERQVILTQLSKHFYDDFEIADIEKNGSKINVRVNRVPLVFGGDSLVIFENGVIVDVRGGK